MHAQLYAHMQETSYGIEVCVVVQYMVVYELLMSVAVNVLFTFHGAVFSVPQVRLPQCSCLHAAYFWCC